MTTNQIASFSDPDLLVWLNQQTAEQLDEVPFGIVRMNHQGIVVNYSKIESRIIGVTQDYALGKYYFTEIAPCANNLLIAARYAQPELDEEIDYVLSYIGSPVRVRLRLLKSRQSPYQYFLVNPLSGRGLQERLSATA